MPRFHSGNRRVAAFFSSGWCAAHHRRTKIHDARRGWCGQCGAVGDRAADLEGAAIELPSAIPAFLEACAKLAAQAAEHGEFTSARDFIETGTRAAALGEEATAPADLRRL